MVKLCSTLGGDGIKISHIPVVLQNMAEAGLYEKRNREPSASTIIAFEEPENNLEFKFEKKIADTFIKYSSRIHYKNGDKHQHDEGVQVFITTHSPVFYTLNDKPKVNCFYVGKKEDDSSDIKPIPKDSKGKEEIEKVMDLMPLIELSASWKKINETSKKVKEELNELKLSYNILQKPVLVTEGKTDETIIRYAWSKLYLNKEIPFEIISGNTNEKQNASISNAGAGVLQHFIKSVRPEDKITIALWDNDKEGINCFKLNKNFILDTNNKYLKVHKNKKAFGLLLPASEDRIDYEKAENLPIEFYFNDEEVQMKNSSGHGINLKKPLIKKSYGSFTEEYSPDNPVLREIHGSKTVFANEIVPTLPKESFWRFKELFNIILTNILES